MVAAQLTRPPAKRRLIDSSPALAVVGAISGGLAGLLLRFTHFHDIHGLYLLGHCMVDDPGQCTGVPLAACVFPGLFFGLFIGALLWLDGLVGLLGATAFALASLIANAAATMAWLEIGGPLFWFLGSHLTMFSLFIGGGFIAGGIGAGLLAIALRMLTGVRGIVAMTMTGAVLGTLLPLMLVAMPLFHAVWQGCFAVVLGAVFPRPISN